MVRRLPRKSRDEELGSIQSIRIEEEEKMKFEKGQLVISTKGNLGVIIAANRKWCDLLWCSTGYVRTGFPCAQLRRVQ